MTAKGNLLIIDDEENVLNFVKELLKEHADNVFTASTGEKGLEILEKENVDCVICDISLPIFSGIDVIRRAREMDLQVPFIFFSGYGSQQLMVEALKFGALDFINKPNFENLEKIVVKGLVQGLELRGIKREDGNFDDVDTEYQRMLKNQKGD